MANPHPGVSFDNTEYAFAYKTNKELKKANFLFSSMGYQPLVKIRHPVYPLGHPGRVCPSKD
jgi:proline dehydrogenase